jgi:hypothetical protein
VNRSYLVEATYSVVEIRFYRVEVADGVEVTADALADAILRGPSVELRREELVADFVHVDAWRAEGGAL